MRPHPTARRGVALLCLAPLAVGLAACGTTTSTASFKGEQHEAAQTIANLQSDATSSEEKKICANDLSAQAVARLGGAAGCERAIKSQLAEIDNLEVSVSSVQIGARGDTATAQVKGTWSGKKQTKPVSLVKEDGKWKISALG